MMFLKRSIFVLLVDLYQECHKFTSFNLFFIVKDEKRKILSKSCAPERNIRDIYMKRFDSVLKYDSGDESFSSDNESDDILEIGPPKCIKYQAENELVDLPKQLSSENTPNKPFYNKEIKEYLRGGFTCDFCLANVLQWPNFSNQAIYNSLDVKKKEVL